MCCGIRPVRRAGQRIPRARRIDPVAFRFGPVVQPCRSGLSTFSIMLIRVRFGAPVGNRKIPNWGDCSPTLQAIGA